jgi:hypothetical protein
MLMHADPVRELDRLTQQVLGTAARPAAMPMDAYRQGDSFHIRLSRARHVSASVSSATGASGAVTRTVRYPETSSPAPLMSPACHLPPPPAPDRPDRG